MRAFPAKSRSCIRFPASTACSWRWPRPGLRCLPWRSGAIVTPGIEVLDHQEPLRRRTRRHGRSSGRGLRPRRPGDRLRRRGRLHRRHQGSGRGRLSLGPPDQRRDHRRYFGRARRRRVLLGLSAHRSGLSGPARGRTDSEGLPDPVLGGGHPDDDRHRAVADLRIAALLPAGAVLQVPVRPPLVAAERLHRRRHRGRRGRSEHLRRRAAVRRHAADHVHRHAGRGADRADVRHLPVGLRLAVGPRGRQAGARNPGRHSDRRLRLLRRADGRAVLPRPRRKHRPWRRVGIGAGGRHRHGHHDHPLRLVACRTT